MTSFAFNLDGVAAAARTYTRYAERLATQDRARVRAAAARLDQHIPDWYTRVDENTLDMMNGTQCVLGQVFGGYDRGIAALYGDRYAKMAFNRDVYAFNGDVPRALWFAEIRARRDHDRDRDLTAQVTWDAADDRPERLDVLVGAR